jgi:ubiquinone biosynthesis protein
MTTAQAPTHMHSSLVRATQIALVLAHHELWHFIDILDLGRFVPFHRSDPSQQNNAGLYSQPEHLRMALEELGPTFMKLGQMLSTRADLLPTDYQIEFAKLQDAAPTIPIETVHELISAELGQPLEHIFATFDATPLAAASIGQAHRATLQDETEVVVKVRRPGAVEQVDEDLKLLHSLASAASERWELAEQYGIVGLVQEFDQSLRAELDYLREGRNTERFAKNLASESNVRIPRVFWETTTSRVLTEERISGIKVTDLAALDAAGIDRAALSKHGAQIFLKMVFEDGFFHADLHPGNFFIEQGGRIGLIDFGMVGTVDEDTRQTLGVLLLGMIFQDADRLVDGLLELGMARQSVDRPALRRDMAQMLSRYADQLSGPTVVGSLLTEVLSLLRRHHLVLPSNLALLFKTIVMIEGMGIQLDPSFNLVEVLTPYAQKLMLQQNSPLVWTKRFGRAGVDLAWLSTELPGQLRQLLSELEQGSLKINIQPTGLDALFSRVERVANRIVLGVIVAAFIVGLAVLISFSHLGGSVLWSWALTIGFVLAIVFALYLVWSIFRSGHH